MDYLKVHDWEEWQSYRKDRGQPPWIKIHREIMRKPKWVALSDEEKGQLVSILILAADEDGSIPNDPALIQKLCYMQRKPNLKRFQELHWLESNGCQSDAIVTPNGCQHDPPEKSRVEENREEESNGVNDATMTPQKLKFKEFVFLTQEEHSRLIKEFGQSDTEWLISTLDNYIGAAPKKRNKYEDHNRVLRGWVLEKLQTLKAKPDSDDWKTRFLKGN